MVRVLLEADANVNKSSQLNGSALFVAAQYGHVPLVKTLIEAGADQPTTPHWRFVSTVHCGAKQ